jgi:hypothetical protein
MRGVSPAQAGFLFDTGGSMPTRSPIPYLQVDASVPLPFRRVEEIIRAGEFIDWDPMHVRLGQIGDGGKRRPDVYEFTCEMEDGLLAVFRSETDGIPQAYLHVNVSTQTDRHQAAYAVSHIGGFELVPVCARREHPQLGWGTLTAMIDGVAFLFVDPATRDTKGVRGLRGACALEEAYAFDFTIGSGQRIESSYVVDAQGVVRSQCHHEAFSWTEDARIEKAFSNSSRRISEVFLRRFDTLSRENFQSLRLRAILSDRIPDSDREQFFVRAHRIGWRKSLGQTRCVVDR